MTNKTNLVQPAYNSPTWSTPLNSNFGIIDNSFGATTTIAVTSTVYALQTTDVQSMGVLITGALSNNSTVLIPAGVSGFWIFTNATTGTYTITVYSNNGSGGAAGAGVLITQGYSSTIYSDGTNVFYTDNNILSLVPTPPALPSGMISPYATTTAPTGWLVCDGTAYSRTTYANLFRAIGVTWGGGDGVTTFNVPNLQGAFPRGAGAGLNPSTRAVGSYEADGFASHTHTVTDPGHTHGLTWPNSTYWGGSTGIYANGSSSPSHTTYTAPSATNSATTGITNSSTGGVETTVKNYAVLYCIKT